MASFWRRAAFGSLIGIVALGAYDQHEITTLKAQLADAQAQLGARKAPTAVAFAKPAPPLPASAQHWVDIPDRAAVTVNVDPLGAATRARDALWNRSYKRPPSCDNPPDNAAFVACGNAYIAARDSFRAAHPIKEFMPSATQ